MTIHGYCAKTNTQSNTAFRGFGGPQGALVIEMILERIARQLELDPLEVRTPTSTAQTSEQRHALRQTVDGQRHRMR